MPIDHVGRRTILIRAGYITNEDRRLLWGLAMAQVPQDLRAIERGDEPQALNANNPLYVSP